MSIKLSRIALQVSMLYQVPVEIRSAAVESGRRKVEHSKPVPIAVFESVGISVNSTFSNNPWIGRANASIESCKVVQFQALSPSGQRLHNHTVLSLPRLTAQCDLSQMSTMSRMLGMRLIVL